MIEAAWRPPGATSARPLGAERIPFVILSDLVGSPAAVVFHELRQSTSIMNTVEMRKPRWE